MLLKLTKLFLSFVFLLSYTSLFASPHDSLQVKKLLLEAKERMYTDPEMAAGISAEALEISQKNELPYFEAKSYLYLGILNHIQSQYPEGIDNLNHALELSKEYEFSNIRGNVLLNLGNIYYGLTDALTAVDYFYKAAALFEEINELEKLGAAYNNIALILNANGEQDEALKYFKKSLSLARKNNNQTGIENARANIAVIYLENEQTEQALDILLEQNRNFHQTKNIYRLAQNRYNIARVFAITDNLTAAMDTMYLAYTTFKNFDNTEGMIGSGLLLANWYLQQGNISKAETWCKSLQKLTSADNALLNEVLLLKAEIEKENQNYTAATQTLEELIQLNDTLSVQRYHDMMFVRQANFEVEKKQLKLEQQLKEQELQLKIADMQQTRLYVVMALSTFLLLCLIVIGISVMKMREFSKKLHASNKYIQAQLKQLEELNQSKNRMFSIIAHDLKSPLASMQPALRLISDDEVEKEEREFLLNSLLQVVEISDFNMENILHWAQQQMVEPSTEFTTFSLNNTLKEILPMYRLLLRYKQVELETDIENGLMVLADRNQISFVIRNLIHNAIKFTYPGGKIKIQAAASEGVIVFSVSDNGQGMSSTQIMELMNHRHLKSTAGTSLETGSGLGLRLSIEYIMQNNSTYTIGSDEGNGTRFTVYFPGEKVSSN